MNIQRNEPCYCGSSKKYKKCCYRLDQACRIPYQVSYDPLPSGPQEVMAFQDRERFQEIAESLIEDKHAEKSFIRDLLVLKKKYPEIPQLYNYLMISYVYLGERVRAEEIVSESQERLPDYIFNKTQKANRLIDEKKHQQVLEIFPELSLHKTYPLRSLFHVSEIVAFLATIGRFYLYEFKIAEATQCFGRATELRYHQPVLDILEDELASLEGVISRAAKTALREMEAEEEDFFRFHTQMY